MNSNFEIDKATNVAYLDLEEAAQDAIIRVHSVSEALSLKCEVLVRLDIKNKLVLGLIIEDYGAFKREVRWKYLAWRVEKLVELLADRVKSTCQFDHPATDSHALLHAN